MGVSIGRPGLGGLGAGNRRESHRAEGLLGEVQGLREHGNSGKRGPTLRKCLRNFHAVPWKFHAVPQFPLWKAMVKTQVGPSRLLWLNPCFLGKQLRQGGGRTLADRSLNSRRFRWRCLGQLTRTGLRCLQAREKTAFPPQRAARSVLLSRRPEPKEGGVDETRLETLAWMFQAENWAK